MRPSNTSNAQSNSIQTLRSLTTDSAPAFVNRVFKGFGGAEDYERAEVAFNKALAIDPKLIEARMLMVFVYLWRGQKAEGARRGGASATRSAR